MFKLCCIGVLGSHMLPCLWCQTEKDETPLYETALSVSVSPSACVFIFTVLANSVLIEENIRVQLMAWD